MLTRSSSKGPSRGRRRYLCLHHSCPSWPSRRKVSVPLGRKVSIPLGPPWRKVPLGPPRRKVSIPLGPPWRKVSVPLGPPGARYLFLLALPGARYLSLLALLGARYLWRLTASTTHSRTQKCSSSSAFRFILPPPPFLRSPDISQSL